MRKIKEVYSRRTKKEKIFTVGVLAMMVLFMVVVVAKNALLATYIMCALPTIILSAAAIDEVSQKKTEFALPFYFYILLFFVERFFYEPMAINVVTWFVVMLLSAMAYMWASGQKGKLFYGMAAVAVVLFVVEKAIPLAAVLRYLILMALNFGVSYVMNRASVLKKKYWLAVMCVLYVVVFFVTRLI